ncbi:MAG: alpha/beta fold hydrolase [Lutibacter sp.]|uniref:alpha/beta hydrolase family protein n=1 Tax=Lutibacter sp. TaxID=1925666 RepID=UPI001A03DC73|nr:alpha/beta hydrolase [Lutibacter sp.]NOR27325.1 alpha/beta fold hydrolase [Lutibacter sp.]
MNKLNGKELLPQNNIPKVPSSILLVGKILQFISPSLATIFAVKLFKTPIKFKTPEREKLMAKSAKKELLYIPELNKKLMVYSYGYSKRKVLLIHGWAGRGTQLFKIADKLLENGFMTISFDGPAHGKSTGKTTMMNEFVIATELIESTYGPFEFAIGHSLGGMAVLNSVKKGLQLKKVVTIGAGDVITDIITDFVKKIELKPKMVGKIKKYFYNKFGKDIDDYSASNSAKNVQIPTLVIHDTEDIDVPVSCAYNIRQNLKQGELLITNGLGHRRILKDNQVISRIIEFIQRN